MSNMPFRTGVNTLFVTQLAIINERFNIFQAKMEKRHGEYEKCIQSLLQHAIQLRRENEELRVQVAMRQHKQEKSVTPLIGQFQGHLGVSQWEFHLVIENLHFRKIMNYQPVAPLHYLCTKVSNEAIDQQKSVKQSHKYHQRKVLSRTCMGSPYDHHPRGFGPMSPVARAIKIC